MIQHPTTEVNKLFIMSFDIIAGENNTTKDRRDTFFQIIMYKKLK